jgi:hypothetical protein
LVELERQAFEAMQEASAARGRVASVVAVAWHYRWAQIFRRACTVANRKWKPDATILAVPVPEELFLRELDVAAEIAEIVTAKQFERSPDTAEALLNGRLTRLNETLAIGWPVDWAIAKSQSHLWQFQLHYHEFLLPSRRQVMSKLQLQYIPVPPGG